MDDNISDELVDADDIKMLTVLQDFANGFDDDNATGEKVRQELVGIALKWWGKKLSSEKIKSLVEKYKQPRNCKRV